MIDRDEYVLDKGLWPLVRAHNPSAGPLLDAVDADHRRIAPAFETLTAAGARYAKTTIDEPCTELVAALKAG